MRRSWSRPPKADEARKPKKKLGRVPPKSRLMKLDGVELYLRSAVSWLDSPQPDREALMSHHGMWADRRFDGRSISLTPTGAEGRPVIVFDGGAPFTDRDLDNIVALVNRITPVRNTWNGTAMIWDDVERCAKKVMYSTFSLGLKRLAGKDCKRLVETYRLGCPKHGNSVFCQCGWHDNGTSKAIKPEGWH